MAKHCETFGLQELRTLNTGLMYFERGHEADGLFEAALAMQPRYDEYGFTYLGKDQSDEPLIAVAMGRQGHKLYNDDERLMRGLMDSSWLKINALSGTCAFETSGVVYEPAILHFNAGYWEYFHYKRERAKLRAVAQWPWLNERVITALFNGAWNVCYMLEILLRRLARRIVCGQKVSFNNWIPVSRYG